MSVTIRYAPDNPVRVGEHHHTGLHGSRIVTFEHQRGGRVAKPVTHNYRDSENSYTTSRTCGANYLKQGRFFS